MVDTKKTTLVALIAQLVLSFAFCIAAFITTNSCFKKLDGKPDDCPEGTGVDMLFRIKKGEGFLLVVSGLVFFAVAFAGLYLLNRGTHALNYGALLGMNAITTVLALMIGANYGSYSLMMSDFTCKEGIYLFIGGGSKAALAIGEKSGDNGGVAFETLICDGVGHDFAAIVALSALIFLVNLGINGMLWSWKGDFINEGLLGGNGGGSSSAPGAYDNLGDMKQGGLYSAPPTADL